MRFSCDISIDRWALSDIDRVAWITTNIVGSAFVTPACIRTSYNKGNTIELKVIMVPNEASEFCLTASVMIKAINDNEEECFIQYHTCKLE